MFTWYQSGFNPRKKGTFYSLPHQTRRKEKRYSVKASYFFFFLRIIIVDPHVHLHGYFWTNHPWCINQTHRNCTSTNCCSPRQHHILHRNHTRWNKLLTLVERVLVLEIKLGISPKKQKTNAWNSQPQYLDYRK